MPFFGPAPAAPAPQPGGAPGQARNTRANYPPAGTGIAEAAPGGYAAAMLRRPVRPVIGRGFASNGTGAGNVQGGGLGGAAGAGGNTNRLIRQQIRQLGSTPAPGVAPSMPAMPADAPPDPAAVAATDPTGANRPGYEWRDARREAVRAGIVDRPESRDGHYTVNGATPDGMGGYETGADRNGMDWRRMRREAKADGTWQYTKTGANRPGFEYRRERRQYNRMFPDEAAAGSVPGAVPKGGAPGAPVA